MDAEQPRFLVMAGPNGSGKSTCASFFLPPSMPCINADDIAKTLDREQTREAEIQAARIALQLMDQAEANRESFATETTLASKTLASRAARLRKAGYFFHLVYLWTPTPDFSVQRVAGRVKLGGHDHSRGHDSQAMVGGVEELLLAVSTDRRPLGCRG